MKAAVFIGKEQIKFENNYDYPKLRKDGIIIKVKSCAICGSDVDAYLHETIPPPRVLGHEFAGEIVEIGERIEIWKVGDRVTVAPHIHCNKCYYCINDLSNLCTKNGGIGFTQDGAFAEFVKVNLNEHHVLKIPDKINYDYAALVETYAIAYHAVKNSKIDEKKSVVIIGAGAMGLFVLLCLKQMGVENVVVIELNDFNKQKALDLGATSVFKPEEQYTIRKLMNNLGPDYIFECVGLPQTYIQSINLVRKAGTVVFIGLHKDSFEFNFFPMMIKELTLKTVTSTTGDDMNEILSILEKKYVNLDPFITKHVQLSELDDTFKWLLSPERQAVKVFTKF